MIAPSGTITYTVVIPVVQDHVTCGRNIGIILNPDSCFLRKVNHVLTGTLHAREDVGKSSCNESGRCRCSTPSIVDSHLVSGAESRVVEHFQDCFVFSTSFFDSYILCKPINRLLSITHISYPLIILRKIVLVNKFHVVCHIGRTCGISVSLDGFQIFLRISDPFKILISGKLNELKVTPDTFLHRIIDTEIVFDRSQRTYGVLFLSSHIDTLACPLRTAFESEVVMISGSKFGIAPTRFKNCLCNDRAMYFDPVLCCILLYELRYLFNKFLIRHNVSLLCEEGRMALPCAY